MEVGQYFKIKTHISLYSSEQGTMDIQFFTYILNDTPSVTSLIAPLFKMSETRMWLHRMVDLCLVHALRQSVDQLHKEMHTLIYKIKKWRKHAMKKINFSGILNKWYLEKYAGVFRFFLLNFLGWKFLKLIQYWVRTMQSHCIQKQNHIAVW